MKTLKVKRIQEFKVFEVSKHEFVLHWLLYINTSMPHLHQYLDLMSQFMCVMIFDPAEKDIYLPIYKGVYGKLLP